MLSREIKGMIIRLRKRFRKILQNKKDPPPYKEIEQEGLNSDYLSATLNNLILQRSLYWNVYNVFVR